MIGSDMKRHEAFSSHLCSVLRHCLGYDPHMKSQEHENVAQCSAANSLRLRWITVIVEVPNDPSGYPSFLVAEKIGRIQIHRHRNFVYPDRQSRLGWRDRVPEKRRNERKLPFPNYGHNDQ
jgi:hypothetical protein